MYLKEKRLSFFVTILLVLSLMVSALPMMEGERASASSIDETSGEESIEESPEENLSSDRLTIKSLFDRGEQLEDDYPYDMDTIKNMTLEDLNWTKRAIDEAPDWNLTYEDPETGENKSLRIIEGTFGGEDMLGNDTYRMYPKEQMQSGNLTEQREVNLRHGGILILPHDHENASGKGNGMFMHTHSLPSVSDDVLVQQLMIAVAERFEVPVFLMGEFSQNWETFNFTSEDDIIYPSLMPGMMKDNASTEYLKMFYAYALVRGNLLGHTVFERLTEEFGLHLQDGILSEGGSKQGHARYFAGMLDDRIGVAQADLLMLQDKINATKQYYKDWGRPPIQNHTGWANYSNQIASITTAIGDSWTSGIQDPNSPTRSIYEVWDIHHQAHLLKDLPLLSISGTLGVGAYDDGEYHPDHDGTYFSLPAESNFLDRLDDLGVEWRYGKERSTTLSSGYPLLENRMYCNALNGLSVLVEEEDTLNGWPKVGDVETAVEGHNATHDWFNVTAEVKNAQENMTVKLRFAGNSDRRWNDPEHVPDVGEHAWEYENMSKIGEEDGKEIYEVSILTRNDLMYGHYVEVDSPGVNMYLFGEWVELNRYDISPVRLLNEYEPEVDGVTDLFVEDHQIEPGNPEQGEEVDLTLQISADRPKIWLKGPYESLPPLQNVEVELRVNGEMKAAKTVSIVREKELHLNWTMESQYEEVEVAVDSTEVVPEYDEDNNRLDLVVSPYETGGFVSPYEPIDWEEVDHYDANFHTHTTESDGDHDPAEVIDMYHEGGYDALAITDHDTEADGTTYPWTDYGRDPEELGMVGVEGNELSYHHHMGSLFNDFPGETFDEHESLQEIGERDGLAMFYHPGEYSHPADWYLEYYREYDHLVGQEVYNKKDSHPEDREFYDNVLHELLPERPIWLFGNDDMHSKSSHFGWNRNVFPLENLSEDGLKRAVENGSFYLWRPEEQQQAPTFQITNIEDDRYSIDIEVEGEVNSIDWMTFDPVEGESGSIHHGSEITLEDISEDTRFVRAELQNNDGTIYTQPFWLDGPMIRSPEPEDGSSTVNRSPELSVNVAHPDDEDMDVSFHNAADDSMIGAEANVSSGEDARTSWENLEPSTTYEWYVLVDDGVETFRSQKWGFFTGSSFEMSINTTKEVFVEGETITARYEVMNSGGAEDTQDVVFTVHRDGEEVHEDIEENVTLSPEETYNGAFSWETEKSDEGGYELAVASDDDEENITVEVIEDALFDVEIVGYEEVIEEGEEMTLDYKVLNTGGVEDTQVIDFTVNGSSESEREVTLEPGEEHEGEFSWSAEAAGGYALAVESEDTYDEITVTVIETPEYALSIEVEGNGTTDPEPGVYTYEEGENVTVTATPDEGWEFVEWTGDVDGESEQTSIIMDSDKEVTAHFERTVEYYALKVNVQGEGEVEIDPDQDEYEEGTEVNLTAVPDEGWNFVEWTGDNHGTEEEITITMDENRSITAVFEEMTGEPYFEVDMVVMGYEDGVTEGEKVSVKYFVNNTGDAEGTQDIILRIDDEEIVVEENLTLEPGEGYQGTFAWETEEGDAGDYNLLIVSDDEEDGMAEPLTVQAEKDDAEDNYWLLGIIAMIVVMIAIAWMLMK
ncbi:MAG: InlB B-repeat-containing protein, partial [Candidatus Aenigmatarchaeota archaeon]